MTFTLDDVLSRIEQIQSALSVVEPQSDPSAFANVLNQTSSSDSSNTTSSAGTVSASSLDTTSADPSTASAAAGSSIVADAKKYLGVPYQWGGTNPSTGLDCSGLVQLVFSDLGTSVPRTSQQQATVGTPVDSLADAQPGDLVFYAGSDGTPTSPGHVGIYIGNGQMIDAPYTGANVRVDPVGTPVAIRRVALTPTSPAVSSSSLSPQSATSGQDATSAAVGGSSAAGVSSADSSAAATGRPADLGISSYTSDFVTAAAAHNVPAGLLAAVAKVESGLNPNALSPAGAQGLMQIMPGTAASLGVNPWDPASAIDGAARLLSSDYQRFGSWPLALAAYNAGPGAVASYGGIPPYPETQHYVANVLSIAGMSS